MGLFIIPIEELKPLINYINGLTTSIYNTYWGIETLNSTLPNH